MDCRNFSSSSYGSMNLFVWDFFCKADMVSNSCSQVYPNLRDLYAGVSCRCRTADTGEDVTITYERKESSDAKESCKDLDSFCSVWTASLLESINFKTLETDVTV